MVLGAGAGKPAVDRARRPADRHGAVDRHPGWASNAVRPGAPGCRNSMADDPQPPAELIRRLPATFGPALQRSVPSAGTSSSRPSSASFEAQVDWLSRAGAGPVRRALFAPLFDIENRMALPHWEPGARGMSGPGDRRARPLAALSRSGAMKSPRCSRRSTTDLVSPFRGTASSSAFCPPASRSRPNRCGPSSPNKAPGFQLAEPFGAISAAFAEPSPPARTVPTSSRLKTPGPSSATPDSPLSPNPAQRYSPGARSLIPPRVPDSPEHHPPRPHVGRPDQPRVEAPRHRPARRTGANKRPAHPRVRPQRFPQRQRLARVSELVRRMGGVGGAASRASLKC